MIAYFSQWNLMRLIRLAMGIYVLYQGYLVGDKTVLLLGAWFTAMPMFNLGCCGTSCYTPTNTITETREITYEEVR
ncbi:MAG: hypothetical protein U0T84_04540 [Chitinophagales bacterium]